jgi:hypothetical protein
MRTKIIQEKRDKTVEKIFFGESQPEEPNLERCEPISQTIAPTSSKRFQIHQTKIQSGEIHLHNTSHSNKC